MVDRKTKEGYELLGSRYTKGLHRKKADNAVLIANECLVSSRRHGEVVFYVSWT